MRLLEWLFGRRATPSQIREALDAAATASEDIADARKAVRSYWEERRITAAAASSKVIDDYQAAELARLARRHR